MNKHILELFEPGLRITALDLGYLASVNLEYARLLDGFLQPCERCGLAFNAIGGKKLCNHCKEEGEI